MNKLIRKCRIIIPFGLCFFSSLYLALPLMCAVKTGNLLPALNTVFGVITSLVVIACICVYIKHDIFLLKNWSFSSNRTPYMLLMVLLGSVMIILTVLAAGFEWRSVVSQGRRSGLNDTTLLILQNAVVLTVAPIWITVFSLLILLFLINVRHLLDEMELVQRVLAAKLVPDINVNDLKDGVNHIHEKCAMLFRLGKKFKESFSIPITLIVLHLVMCLILNPTYLLYTKKDADTSRLALVLMEVVEVAFVLANLAFLTESSNKVNFKKTQIEELLSEILMLFKNNVRYNAEPIFMLKELRLKFFKFHFCDICCGFFTLNRQFFTNALGILVTYCVISYQIVYN